MSRTAVLGKYAAEQGRFYPVDFAAFLAPTSDQISSVAVSVTLFSGVDPGPSLTATSSFSGSVVTVALSAGIAGCVYDVRVTATTIGAQHVSISFFLPVLPDQP